MKVEQLLVEATDVKGAVSYVQGVFDKAGLTIKVTSRGKNELLCKGSINRAKYSFTITLVDGRKPSVQLAFIDFDISKMMGTAKGVNATGANLSSGRGLDALYKQIRNFVLTADNTIAEIKVVKTFLVRFARCIDKISNSIAKG